jgi:hypothetical protein
LALTTDLGYELAVTPWTVAELRYSLERARDYLKSKPLPPGELAALAAEATTDENFIVSYWRRIRDKPTSVDDFFDFYNEIEVHLAEHHIAVVTDGCQAVDRDEERLAEEMSAIDRVPGPRLKPDPVKEHDVKHRLLILRRRGASNRRFANAGFWFLTADSSLPRYDYVARGGAEGLPFCATASGWTQVMRSFVPRTADMDQTLTDLLSSPYIRYRGRIAYDTVREVASRLELFKGSTPGLAAAVLMNTALLRELAETAEEEARNELIDNAVVAAASDLERQLTEERGRAEHERQRRTAALRTVTDVADQLADEQAQVTTLHEQLEAERHERERQITEAKTELEQERLASGHAIESVRAQLVSLHRTLSLVGAAVLVVAALAGTVIPIHSGAVHGALPVALVIAAGSLLLVAAAGLAAGWKRAWLAFGAIAVVVGFVAAVFELLRG